MKHLVCFLLVSSLAIRLTGQQPYGPEPLAHTFSIVAYDEATGEMGAAVQSHWFATGTIVIWGEAGVGVVATQSFVNPAFGPEGLAKMQAGISPREALQQLLAVDEGREFRQVALLNSQGEAAAFTGAKCIEAAGHQEGKHYSVQANLMDNERVWPAMAAAFEASAGKPLAERLLLTMEAAQAAGGDIRGKQSAALLVVGPEGTGQPWVDRRVDLRIDDHPNPLVELRRLLRVHQAYGHMNAGDLAVEKGDIDLAVREYSAAEAMFPANLEMQFWHAITLANSGRLEEALPIFKRVFKKGKNWKTLTPRLIKNGLLTVDEAGLQRILRQ